MNTPQSDNWKNGQPSTSRGSAHIKTNPSKGNYSLEIPLQINCFRSLQYRIAVEVEPEFAPKILEIVG